MGLDIGGGTKELPPAWRIEQDRHSRTALDESLIFNS